MKKEDKKIKALELAEKVKLLFVFCADLIPDKEMLKDTYKLASEKQSMSLSMAPIFGAFGQDYEEVHLQKEVERKRAKALYDLIDTLDRTEKERSEYAEKKKSRQVGLEKLHKALGL